ncbi:hypothetical protein GH714_011586 [Hevea brasiliensis]|uniref:Uncharacterized protein n=1 Tax=Hevea brasiliensis TaxID=3981 RepID=A0A6A6NGK0_HEVBR|nr:hypothetical protein GH714_011586 [Hevea brasiliensis]
MHAWQPQNCVNVSKQKEWSLQCLRQNLKLISILKGQMIYLEEFALIDQDFSSSLSGAIEALRASTLRLPIVGGARDAICSALDVMQAMASSVCILLSKVGEVNSLVAELANVAGKEHALLDQCKDLLSIIAAVQVKEYSLGSHFIQLKRIPSSLTAKVYHAFGLEAFASIASPTCWYKENGDPMKVMWDPQHMP